jgi:uncharacterized damage-inducible protein DinB/GNAT superfamily N-acetyltransferase
MPAPDTLRDLWAHHAWADAEHWRAFEASPRALEDAALFSRLHHIHLTQSVWVWAIGDRRQDPVLSTPGDFTPGTLEDLAMAAHQALARVAASDEEELERLIDIPWFPDPPLRLSVREGLTQVAMHSHYHRGQNATRFRELGGEPPGTDLITWIWKGRPAPRWPPHEPAVAPRARRPGDVVCRPAVASEQEALEALQRRASLGNAGDREALLANPDAIELPLAQILEGRVYVAERDGVTLGFAAVLPRGDGGAELDALFVEPRCWKQGVGRSLVEHCAASARSMGSAALHVVGNPHAEGFYAACGFERTGTVQTRFGVGLALRRAL